MNNQRTAQPKLLNKVFTILLLSVLFLILQSAGLQAQSAYSQSGGQGAYAQAAQYAQYSQSSQYGGQLNPGYESAGQSVANPPSNDAAVIDSMAKLDDSRALKVGDYLSFRIVEEKSAVQTLRIMDSGEVLIPHIGLVTAKDRTCKKLAYIAKQELEKEYFKSATVIIALDSSRENRYGGHGGYGHRGYGGYGGYAGSEEGIVVFGQVMRQGKLPFPPDGELTISTAILHAGGFSRFANRKKVRVYRKIPGVEASEGENDRRVIMVNVDRIMKRGDLSKDIPLRKDDVIIVPERIFNF